MSTYNLSMLDIVVFSLLCVHTNAQSKIDENLCVYEKENILCNIYFFVYNFTSHIHLTKKSMILYFYPHPHTSSENVRFDVSKRSSVSLSGPDNARNTVVW